MGSRETGAGAPIHTLHPSIHQNSIQAEIQPTVTAGDDSPVPPGASRPAHHAPGRHSPEWPQEATMHLATVRYRGFVLIPQGDLSWLIRPERSPMRVLPFRVPASSLSDVKALIDWRVAQS